jgi:hypothetical protein
VNDERLELMRGVKGCERHAEPLRDLCASARKHRSKGGTTRFVIKLSFLALITTPASPLLAQRIAPSSVQRLEVAANTLSRADSVERRSRSHVDGAVHGGLVGFGAGAITGAGFFGLAYAAAGDIKHSATSGEQLFAFWMITGAGAVAGTAIGALIGGIIGR